MGGVVVCILDGAPLSLRGKLTRWLLEVKSGVLVGTVNATVRDLLWKKVQDRMPQGNAIMLHSADTEQGFTMRMHGLPRRKIVDIEGLQLICVREMGKQEKEKAPQ